MYFKAGGEWTPDPARALGFKLINNAIRRADKMGLRGVELVVRSANPAHLTTLPVGILDNARQPFGKWHD